MLLIEGEPTVISITRDISALRRVERERADLAALSRRRLDAVDYRLVVGPDLNCWVVIPKRSEEPDLASLVLLLRRKQEEPTVRSLSPVGRSG